MLFFCREVQNQLSGGEWLNLARASEQQEGSGQLPGPYVFSTH